MDKKQLTELTFREQAIYNFRFNKIKPLESDFSSHILWNDLQSELYEPNGVYYFQILQSTEETIMYVYKNLTEYLDNQIHAEYRPESVAGLLNDVSIIHIITDLKFLYI